MDLYTHRDVGDEHRWESSITGRELKLGGLVVRWLVLVVVDAALAAAAGDDDRGAVHVHFAVTDFVEPSPCEGVFARCDALRHTIFKSGWIGGVGVAADVACAGSRATTFDGVNDLED